MTPQDAILELLARLGADNGGAVLISDEELSHWPAVAVKAMKSQELLVRARAAASVVCPGCEQECVMPVHVVPAGPRGPAFIVCDKRDDINRVPVAVERLRQWRCDTDALCGFVAKVLELRLRETPSINGQLREIGIAAGEKHRQMLCLKTDSDLTLVAGNRSVSLSEFIAYRNGRYSLDQSLIRDLVDSASTADGRYTPTTARRETRKLNTQAIYEVWRRAYRDLRKSRPNMSDVWYSLQIAKRDIGNGRHADTIRKHMRF
jgi:hypothetical protein